MSYRHLRIALVLLVLAAASSMAGPKDQWFTMGSNVVPIAPQYMVKGGSENGRDLFVCRAIVGSKIIPGKTWDGLGGCFVSNEFETLITPYQVLVQPPLVSDYFTYRWASRSNMIDNPGLWNFVVQGGFNSGYLYDPDYRICSMNLWVNGVYLGKHPGLQLKKPPFDFCYVTWGGQVYASQDYDILVYVYAN
jgi:hypothetical protein